MPRALEMVSRGSLLLSTTRNGLRGCQTRARKTSFPILKETPMPQLKQYDAALKNRDFNVFYNAPCLVFVGGSKKIGSLQVDCALAACYFMFSASERGLATCWIGLGTSIHDSDIKKQIGMPENYRIVAPIVVGYPKNIPDIPERAEPQILKVVF